MSYVDRWEGDRSDSLFCTPPPEDDAVNKGSARRYIYERQGRKSEASVEDIAPEDIVSLSHQEPSFHCFVSEESLQHTRQVPACTKVGDPLATHNQRSGCAEGGSYDRRISTMMPMGNSLTSTSGRSRASPTITRTYFVADSALSSHFSTRSPTSTNKCSIPASRSPNPSSTKHPTGRLIDYSSSKDEAEVRSTRQQQKQPGKRRKKQETKRYKSAEFVQSEGDDSNAETSDHQPRLRKRSPASYQQIKNNKASAESSNMVRKPHGGMSSLTFGASESRLASGTKKRPMPPGAPSIASKRQKTGPFIVESHSESDGERDSDDDNGFNLDQHIGATPRLLEKSRRNDAHALNTGRDRVILFKGANQQQTAHNRPKCQLSTPQAAPTPSLARGGLNRSRLMSLLQQKQGVAVAHDHSQQLPPQSGVTGANLRKRPIDGMHTGNSPLQSSTPRQAAQSAPSKTMSVDKPEHRAPQSALGKPQEQPSNRADKALQSKHTFVQRYNDPQVVIPPARQQQRPSTSNPKTSSPRKTNIARAHNAANSRSLWDTLGTAKAGYRSPAKEQNNFGSEWQKAQAAEASTRPAKQVQRPEAGARYGHTLTARKTAAAKREHPGAGGASTAATANILKTPAQSSQLSAQTPYPILPRTRPPSAGAPSTGASSMISNASSSPANDVRPAAPIERRNALVGRSPQAEKPTPVGDRTLSAPSSTLEGTNVERVPRPVEAQEQRSLNPSSKTNTPNPNAKTAAQASSTSEQSKIKNDDQARGVVKELSTDTVSSKEPQTNHNSIKANVSSPSLKPAPMAQIVSVSRSSYSTQMKSVESPILGEFPGSSLPEKPTAPTHDEAPNVTEALELQQDNPTAPASVKLNPEPSSVGTPILRVPVAMMVRPERVSAARSAPSPGNVSSSDSASGSASSGSHEPDVTLPEFYECFRSLTSESQGRVNIPPVIVVPPTIVDSAADLASEMLEPMDIDPERAALRTFGRGHEVPEAAHVAGGLLGKTSTSTLKPVETPLLNFVKAAPLEHAGRTIKETAQLHSLPKGASLPSNSPGNPTPISMEVSAQLKATARRLSPQTTLDLSTLQSSPALDTSEHSELLRIASPVEASHKETQTLTMPAEIILPSPTLSSTAEPYFEYTVHQTLSSATSSDVTTELSAQPLTSLQAAKAQIEKFVQSAKQQYEILGLQCRSSTSTIDENGLPSCEAKLQSAEDPSKTLSFEFWVSRDEVGLHANHTPPPLAVPSTLSKTVYALRLWKLVADSANPESDSDASDSEDNDDNEEEDGHDNKSDKESLRIFHPLPHICTEIHTTLDAANRAAKRVQVYLSHEKDPKSPLQQQWQIQNLQKLNGKLDELKREVDDDKGEDGGDGGVSLFEFEEGRRRGCWRSVFDRFGVGGERFEVLVCTVGVSGPRNV